jgi:Spy/CpxP family protein refolding chaperone
MRKTLQSMVLLYLLFVIALCIPFSGSAFSGEDLNLTDDQKVQLEAIRAEAREAITPLVEQLKALMATMEKILLANEVIDTGESSEAQLLSDEIIGVRTQMMNIKAKAKLASANVLTREQREIIIEKKKTRHERREKRRNRLEDRLEGPDGFPPVFPE